jgi:hypothetical protein
MNSIKPEIKGGSQLLPFDKLSPGEFERMCFWLIKREGFQSVGLTGASGRKNGRDITAEKDDRTWAFQCKRVKRFGPYDADQDLNRLLDRDIPDFFVFIVPCTVTYYTYKKIHQKYPHLEIDFWTGNELDDLVKRHADIMAEFFEIQIEQPGSRGENKRREFLDSIEKWRSNTADEDDLYTIADVLQSGGVNFGQDNQVRVSGSVIGTVNIQFQTPDQASEFLGTLKGREETEYAAANKILVRRQINAFLCHASEDKPDVRKLYANLRKNNVDPWLDEEKLLGGQDWRGEIRQAVRNADVVIVCLSRNSISKEGYVQKELGFALDKAEEKPEGIIYIIPLRLEKCEVPQRLHRWQWINLYQARGYKNLLKALKSRADALGLDPLQY